MRQERRSIVHNGSNSAAVVSSGFFFLKLPPGADAAGEYHDPQQFRRRMGGQPDGKNGPD
jgi:hypothetical protein